LPKVLIADKLSLKAEQIFADNGIEVDVKTGLGEAELAVALKNYDGLVVRSATKVTSAALENADALKVIGRAGVGTDNIDLEAATSRGIVVMNAPSGNSTTTAEHALALMFALARQIPEANSSTQAGKWEKSKFMGVELSGKTLGIIGCGNIGANVAERAVGLKMQVVAYDPFLSSERAADLRIEMVTLSELYTRSDFITLHTPLTDSTRNLINSNSINQMKKGVRIINCARAELVVEEDLAAALEAGHVAGAAVDVFSEEPATENVLFGLSNLVATPHLGAATSEAQENVAIQIAEQISDFLLTGAAANTVNMPSISAEEAPILKPYMRLAEQLGSFAGQLTDSGIEAVSIEFAGHVATLNTRPLVSAALVGLLAPLLDRVHVVNAPTIARDRNVDVSETKNERPGDHQTLIRLTIRTGSGKQSVSGTLFGGDKPRIIEIDNMPVDAEVGPHMLYVRNKDFPGIIGKIGQTLGDGGVNIATFHLGRAERGGDAMALLLMDEPIDSDVLDNLASLENIVLVKALSFDEHR
jgi:D-3-phosphoglycerate dehydrogenase